MRSSRIKRVYVFSVDSNTVGLCIGDCRKICVSQFWSDFYSLVFQDSYFFMNSATFEEIPVSNKIVDDKAQWIGEGSEVKLVLFKDSVIEVIPPSPAIYEIVETEPTMKGNTASSHTKPAVLSCGATITIPGFIEQGQKIKVDTEKGIYLERA
jgi:elongation factor P